MSGRTTSMRPDTASYKRPVDLMPEPGTYDPQKPLGSDISRSMTFGSKLREKINSNPGPGAYDPNDSATKH